MAGFQVAVGSRAIDGRHCLSGGLWGFDGGWNQLAEESLGEIYVGPPISQQIITPFLVSLRNTDIRLFNL